MPHLCQLPRLGQTVDHVQVADILVALGLARLLLHALVDDERAALNLVHDLRDGELWSAHRGAWRGSKKTHFGESSVDESLNTVVADHVVTEADLDDLVLGNRRRDGVEEVGERLERRRLQVFACKGREGVPTSARQVAGT